MLKGQELESAIYFSSPEVLSILATSPHPGIRTMVAKAGQADPDTLNRLACDPCPRVANLLASRLYIEGVTPPRIYSHRHSLWGLLAVHPSPKVRQTLASNPTLDDGSILAILARDDDPKVRLAVANNFNTPQEIIEMLAKDSSRKVKQAALRRSSL